MEEDRLNNVLPLMFREVKIPERAKEDLRQRLFSQRELTDDELGFVAAAGESEELARNRQKNKNLEE